MAIDTNQLMSDARCIACTVPKGYEWPVIVSLARQIADRPDDTNAMMDDAKCIARCIPPGMQMSVLVSIANQIAESNGA